MTGVQTCALPIYGSYDWLPAAFAEVAREGGALTFRLVLPLRSEHAALSRAPHEDARVIHFVANGHGGVRGLHWLLNSEGPREVHLVLEAAYEPAGGPIGWLLEETLHRPLRRQALRDALWLLKLTVEGRIEGRAPRAG